jgi:hypothetical protein
MNDKFGNQLIGEVGTNYPILNLQTYDGGDFTFDIFETDIESLYMALYDIDPLRTSPFAVRPEYMYQCRFTIMGNQYSSVDASTLTEGFVAEQCHITGHDRSQDQKGNMKVTFKGTFAKAEYVKAGGVHYTRAVDSPHYATADDASFVGSVATLTKTAIAVPRPGVGVATDTYLCAIKNKVKTDTGFTVLGNYMTTTDPPSNYDTWDLFTVCSAT